MTNYPDDGPVVFRSTRAPRGSLPLGIERRTLGVLLIVWSLVSIANDSASIQVVFFGPPAPGHAESLLRLFQTTPFPWLWYFFLGPIFFIAFGLVVIAGSILVAVRRGPGRVLTLAGLLLALGAELVTLVVELTSLRPPIQLPWQWAVATGSNCLILVGAIYLLAAATGVAPAPEPQSEADSRHSRDDGPVAFRSTRAPRQALPLAMKRRTLGILLLVWSVLTIANSAVSIQLDIFPPTPPGGHPESALRVLQAMPFPWLWYFILGPACLIACAVLVAAGGARMAIRPNSHPWLAMLGLVLALGTVLTTLVTELASRRAPFNFPWQWAVTQASAAVVVGVGLYLVAAAPRDNLPPSLSSQARDLLKAAP